MKILHFITVPQYVVLKTFTQYSVFMQRCSHYSLALLLQPPELGYCSTFKEPAYEPFISCCFGFIIYLAVTKKASFFSLYSKVMNTSKESLEKYPENKNLLDQIHMLSRQLCNRDSLSSLYTSQTRICSARSSSKITPPVKNNAPTRTNTKSSNVFSSILVKIPSTRMSTLIIHIYPGPSSTTRLQRNKRKKTQETRVSNNFYVFVHCELQREYVLFSSSRIPGNARVRSGVKYST